MLDESYFLIEYFQRMLKTWDDQQLWLKKTFNAPLICKL